MSATTTMPAAEARPRLQLGLWLETLGAWALAALWAAPLLYALWAAIHPTGYATRFELFAPLTLDNFAAAWNAAPFPRYMLNSLLLVTFVTGCQFVLGTLAAFVFARSTSRWMGLLFAVVLVQLMIMPDMLIVENYRTMRALGLVDTVIGIGLPYVASAFGIFLLRQTFKQVPRELEDAARVEGCGTWGILWKVYVPLARPTYLAYGLTSVSYHWNNFLWPLVITTGPTWQVLTVATASLQTQYNGNWTIVMAATTIAVVPLLVLFLVFQRGVVRSITITGFR
jgi:sn-glycerol 3-phosphate transport system permease protein